jgi:Holliday junction resolvasome RuvABC endonuclease subunit
LWCDNYRHLSAKEIHDQYMTLPQKFKDQLLEKKPDTTALAQVFSAAEAAKVSAVGMFKKPVAKETEEKRKHLVKTPGQVNGRVVYKI